MTAPTQDTPLSSAGPVLSAAAGIVKYLPPIMKDMVGLEEQL